MDGEKYVVEIELKKLGDFGIDQVNAKLKKSETGMAAFKKGWSELGSSVSPVGDMIDSVAGKVMNFVKIGAVAGGAALFAGAAYGVAHLNNELEQATISMGTIFNANGMAASVPSGMVKAKNVIAEMRVDAQKLPGEFNELLEIFNNAAIPAFHSGASVEELRKLSGEAMAFGKVAMMENATVARELNMLLEGRAGAHNRLGAHLGLTGDRAKQFNAEAPDKRLADLNKEFHKYAGSIDEFGKSFEAQSSTLIDNFKIFGTTATGPLFEVTKEAMAEANQWFIDHKQEVQAFSTTVGSELRSAFLSVKSAVLEYGPILVNFAETASTRFHGIVYDAEELAKSVGITGASFKSALEDPNGTIDKLKTVLELYAALKIGGGVFGMASGLAGAASGIGGMLSGAGMLGGAAAGGTAAAGGAAAVGTGAVLLAGAAFIAAIGGVTAAVYQWEQFWKEDSAEHAKDSQARADMAVREVLRMRDLGASEVELQQQTNEFADTFASRGDDLAVAMLETQMAALQAAGALRSIDFQGGQGKGITGLGNEDWSKPMNYAFDPTTVMAGLAGKYSNAVQEKDRSPDANAHKSKGGHGGTIQKVEIVVTSNQSPSRIARAVEARLGQVSRMNGASPHVTNVSALNGRG